MSDDDEQFEVVGDVNAPISDELAFAIARLLLDRAGYVRGPDGYVRLDEQREKEPQDERTRKV